MDSPGQETENTTEKNPKSAISWAAGVEDIKHLKPKRLSKLQKLEKEEQLVGRAELEAEETSGRKALKFEERYLAKLGGSLTFPNFISYGTAATPSPEENPLQPSTSPAESKLDLLAKDPTKLSRS